MLLLPQLPSSFPIYSVLCELMSTYKSLLFSHISHTHLPHFTLMENLYFHIAADIASQVDEDSFLDFRGMIGSSKLFQTIVFTDVVLQKVSLFHFFHNPQLINISSLYRLFFSRCVRAYDPTSIYLESLRLAYKEGKAEDGLYLFLTMPNRNHHASFTVALFQLCLGHYDEAMSTLSCFLSDVPSFADDDSIATTVF